MPSDWLPAPGASKRSTVSTLSIWMGDGRSQRPSHGSRPSYLRLGKLVHIRLLCGRGTCGIVRGRRACAREIPCGIRRSSGLNLVSASSPIGLCGECIGRDIG